MPEKAHPKIPEGLATKLGKYGAPLVFALAVLADITGVDLDDETLVGFIGSIVMIVTTMVGRYAQATALVRKPQVEDETTEDEEFAEDEGGTTFAPSENDLRGKFPEEPPLDDPPEGAVSGKAGEAD